MKGSATDYLERIMLSQLNQVVCWRERCERECACINCTEYRTLTPPKLIDLDSNPEAANT
jgi:hypothetical protein